MASKEARQAAIKQASRIVYSWPSYMHRAVCECDKCERRRARERG